MCGRFTLTVDPANLQETFPQSRFPAQGKPRFNVVSSTNAVSFLQISSTSGKAQPVSTLVNSPANEHAALVAEV